MINFIDFHTLQLETDAGSPMTIKSGEDITLYSNGNNILADGILLEIDIDEDGYFVKMKDYELDFESKHYLSEIVRIEV